MFVESQTNYWNRRAAKSAIGIAPRERKSLISVLLVGDEGKFQHSLDALLELYNLSASQQFNIVGGANSRDQAVRFVIERQPSLILLDIDLFEKIDEGIKALTDFKNLSDRKSNDGKTLVLSRQGEDTTIFRAMKAGALGYLLKEDLLSQLHVAITTVIAGKIYMSPEVATKFFQVFQDYEGQKSQENGGELSLLTNREREVLRLLVQGSSNEEIAQALYITVATVKAHLTAIFEKLGVKSRSRAIVRSLQLGMV